MLKSALASLFTLALYASTLNAEEYKPELFKSMELVYENDFSVAGEVDTKQWEIRQNSTWIQKDGVLHGSEAPKDFQEKKLASDDPTHAGLRPVIFLRPIPESFVVRARLRYDGEFVGKQNCELSFGHHLQDCRFSKDKSTIVLHKKENKPLKDVTVPLGQWIEVTAELKKGEFILTIDGKKNAFSGEMIHMVKEDNSKSLQVDFKGLDHGTVMIDWVKVYKGIE
jgi:hypothetical protein